LSVLKASCPSCAAPIEFKAGSTIVLVCPYCRSAVARTDRGLSDLGKVAEIVDSQSPLRVGLKGVWRGHRFELTGRAQNRHELGGFWDEWYATFSNGWVGWLAEAQGRFYLTFYQKTQAALPPFEHLQLGQAVPQIPSKTPLMVTEKGTATAVAAEGEIPYKLTPNEQSLYADLSGAGNAFATIDYSMNPPLAFVGEQVSLADLGLADARPAQREARRVSTAAMGCPNCGGPLSLQAPDKTERVTCPNCNSLLDANQGKLSWLKALKPSPDAHKFDLQIGAKGTFKNGAEMTIIGAVVRSVTVEGIKYFWHEYLLYNPQIGFRWLVHSDNHWTFVEPINAADVVSYGNTVTFGGKTFKIFQDAPARVEFVQGEFYWRVEQGETVRAIDYVKPPEMLSCEMTQNEMNWSRGVYMTNAEIEKAFNVADLPKPWSVAPNQPFTGGFYIKWGFAALILLAVVAIFMIPLSGFTSTAHSEIVNLPPTASANAPQTAFSKPFELKGNRNVRITASAPVSNSWADLDVDLVNEQSQEVESVNVPIEYYSGVDGGESWSEGGQTQDATLSSLPAGRYTLRVEGTWQNFQQPLPVSVKVEQNVTRGMNFCCAFFVLAIVPFFSLIRYFMFEQRRWSESMFTSSGTSVGSGD
jgi:Zn finger protein HypA/HybF involved in hydrogenase expression